jgi:prepilin-type N-terminal cleavage/methylation domain-containing protein
VLKKQTGFTLVELLIVIVIISVLTAITIVSYSAVKNRSNDSIVQSDLQNVAAAIHTYIAANNGLPTSNIETTLTGTILGQSDITNKISTGSYDNTTVAAVGDTYSRNLLICISGGTTAPKFGIAALSKSGSVFFYTSANGPVKDTTPWAGQQTVECPKLGISVSDSGYARTFGYERLLTSLPVTNGWAAWAQ